MFSRQNFRQVSGVCGCFEQGGQYIVIDRTVRTRKGAGLSGPKRADVCVTSVDVI